MVLRFTEEELRNLSLQIGNEWQELGTRLEFENARIQQFRMNNRGDVGNAIFEMLVEWQEQLRSSCPDSLAVLEGVLEKTRRADLAYKIASRNGFHGTTDPIPSRPERTTRGQTIKIDEPDNKDTDQPDFTQGPPIGYQPHSRKGVSPQIHTEGRNNATFVIGDNSNVNIGAFPSQQSASGQESIGAPPSGSPGSSTNPIIYTKGDNNLSLYVGSNTIADIELPVNSDSSAVPSAQTSGNQQKRPFQQTAAGTTVSQKKQKTNGSEIGSLKSFSGISSNGDQNGNNTQDQKPDVAEGGDFVDASPFDQLKSADMTMGDIIGSGTFGDVFRVKFKKGPFRGHKEAAAKKLNKVQPQEVDILRRANHTNVVTLLAYVEEPFIDLIVMELADQSLRQYLDAHKGEVPLQLLEKWVCEVCEAIQYLHGGIVTADRERKPVVHRDLKASNCLLFWKDASSCLKVTDFSISKETDRTLATKTGKGSLPWTAPEVLDKECFSTASDIYGLGVLFWEMYTQKVPELHADRSRKIFGQLLDGELQALFPDHMLTLLPLCWCEDYKDRPTIQGVKDMIPHDSAGRSN